MFLELWYLWEGGEPARSSVALSDRLCLATAMSEGSRPAGTSGPLSSHDRGAD